MGNKQSKRSRDVHRCQPSPADKATFVQLRAKLTPSDAAYEEYRFQTEVCLDTIGTALRIASSQSTLRSLRLRKSELFDGREYLVAYVNDNWLSGIAPNCDAIFSPMSGQTEQEFQLSPFVYLPESKLRARNKIFRSIVEHEFVHVNQAIMGTFPVLPTKRMAGDLLDLFLDRTSSEYEASFLQFVKWPEVIPEEAAALSLEQWCFLRGYSQALEHVLLATAELDFPPLEVEIFLDNLATSQHLQRIGASEEVADWFQPFFIDFLQAAMQQVSAFLPTVKEHPAFRAAGLWLRPRLGETDTPF